MRRLILEFQFSTLSHQKISEQLILNLGRLTILTLDLKNTF